MRKIKRLELEKYLGNKVKIILFDGTEVIGYLKKSDLSNVNVPKKNYYFTTNEKQSNDPDRIVFRCSHVKKCKAI